MFSYAMHDVSSSQGQFAKDRAIAEEGMRVQRGHAVRTVAGHARDAHDLSELLAMLGLDSAEAADRQA